MDGIEPNDIILGWLKQALLAGVPEDEFWRSTPFQTQLKIEAAAERQVIAYRRAMWSAWHAGAFSRVKTMPKLDEILQRIDGRKKKVMSPDELLQAFELINIRTGGKDLRKTAH